VQCLYSDLVDTRWWFGLAGNIVSRINEVIQRRARLLLGWVTVSRRVNDPGM